jgi:hypothetical protein
MNTVDRLASSASIEKAESFAERPDDFLEP